ncbi:MAG: fructose-bisphosphatase class II family protein [Hyphomicrobiaceae bacterium]|nr:fructose-bisphosphatase class II family protein [Hyphomicrobiaceae bacterium]MCC0024510.1 fructose-bisphosphatase class II family protein [Hyphomicrobiaceae bacterium]
MGMHSGLAEGALTLGFVRATELAAIATAEWRGKGDERAADSAAADGLAIGLNVMPMRATISLGEGTHTESDTFGVGHTFGTGEGPEVDLAVDALEGTTLCAKAQNDALVALAASEPGGLMRVPAIYMDKIAIAAGYPEGLIDLNASPADNIRALADAKKVPVREIAACVLDRPRHAALIDELRTVGCSVRLIGDGDIAAVIHAANVFHESVDIYMGSGGAPEGVLAAAAIRCLGGVLQARFQTNRHDFVEELDAAGITDRDRIYSAEDLARGDVLFAATGVTNGTLVDGVAMNKGAYRTSSIVMETWSGTVRRVATRHAR